MVAYLWADATARRRAVDGSAQPRAPVLRGLFGNVVTAISAPGEREMWFGFLQAVRNLGYSIGGVLAGLALQVSTDVAYQSVVVINAITFVIAFVLLLDVPDHRVVHPADAPVEGWGVVLRDTAYLRLVLGQLGFVAGMMVLNFALPVYVAETIDLPGWVVGAIFTLNTALVGLGQGLVVRRMTGRVGARMMGLAQLTSSPATPCSSSPAGSRSGWPIVVMLVGAAIYTCFELTGGPVFSATAAEAAPDHLRGRYLGLFQLSWGIGELADAGGVHVAPRPGADDAVVGCSRSWRSSSAAYLQRLPQVLPAVGQAGDQPGRGMRR